MSCFRFLDFRSMYDVDILTIQEYFFLMKVYQLKKIDRVDELHTLAWLINSATATDDKGKSVYKNYSDFYDKEKEVEKLDGKKRTIIDETMKRRARIAEKLNR